VPQTADHQKENLTYCLHFCHKGFTVDDWYHCLITQSWLSVIAFIVFGSWWTGPLWRV